MPEAHSPEGRAQASQPAPVATNADPVGSVYDRVAFAQAVLRALGAPVSPGNVSFLLAWFNREGTKAAYNPLATTQGAPGATQFNKVGVKNYPTFDAGVQATAKTLTNGRYNGIVADLRADQPSHAASNHPDEFSTWSGGGYTSISFDASTASDMGYSGGGGSGKASDGGLPPNATPDQIEAYVRSHYPQVAGFLDIPELRDVLIDAARNGLDDAETQAKIEQTQWWRTNSATVRSAFLLKTTDPAEWQRQVDEKATQIGDLMRTAGITTGRGPREWAEDALTYGWSEDLLRDHLADAVAQQIQKGQLSDVGSIGLEADRLMDLAHNQYLIPISRNDALHWANAIWSGSKTEDQILKLFEAQAYARFPGLKEQGITPGDYMAPIRAAIAQTLELQPGDVDLLDPRWSGVLEHPTEGGIRPMTISEAQRYARSLPQFRGTQAAKDQAAELVETIGRTFGAVA